MKSLPAWSGSVATNVVNLGFGIATGVLAARLLGPQARGELAEIQFWAGAIAGIGICSLPSALSFFIARGQGSVSMSGSALACALALATLSLTCGLAFIAFAVGPDQRNLQMLYLLFFLPANFIALTLVAIDHGRQDFTRYNFYRLLPQSTYLVGMLVLWQQSALNIPTLLAASWLGTALVCAGRWRLARHNGISVPQIREMAALLRTGIEFHATAFAGILFQNADRVICITYFTHADLGRYAVALALSGAGLGIVSSATSIVLFPKLAAAQSFAARRHLVRNALGASCIVALMINAGIALIIPLLLPFLFGYEYEEAVSVAILLCIAQIPMCFVQTATVALRALNDWRAGPYAQLAALVVFLPSAAVLIPQFGLNGIAASLMLSQIVATGLLLRRLQVCTGLGFVQCVTPEFSWLVERLRWKSA
ncbi:MAG: oligosaccharide flippase family protein [Hyphomicrobium sp.]|uniref:lipopolysaccharide biosynthesis protein n=1 Tax=Hyphomicrobium sp. TaxID=82 RepID=UPI00356363DF